MGLGVEGDAAWGNLKDESGCPDGINACWTRQSWLATVGAASDRAEHEWSRVPRRAQWKLRRLIYEDGEWHCSLSKHIGLPASLDELAEASHESQPLAILSALLEARRNSLAAAESRPQSVPQVRPTRGYAICCDNFA